MTEAYGAPELRYTDRNVREDSDLRDLAEAYVKVYGGEFEPLVAAKNELMSTGRLETRTARIVLNCMRYDVNVSASLPAPQPPSLVLPKKRSRMVDPEPQQCLNTESHSAHWWRPGGEKLHELHPKTDSVFCEGVPWAINRTSYNLPAKVKKPFVHGRGATSLIHRTSGEGWLHWVVNTHGEGFIGQPYLMVKTQCRDTTRVLKNPILLSAVPEGEQDWHARCTQGCF